MFKTIVTNLINTGDLIYQVVLFFRWSYSSGGRIHQVVVFIRWSYSSGGLIHQVVIFIRWSYKHVIGKKTITYLKGWSLFLVDQIQGVKFM